MSVASASSLKAAGLVRFGCLKMPVCERERALKAPLGWSKRETRVRSSVVAGSVTVARVLLCVASHFALKQPLNLKNGLGSAFFAVLASMCRLANDRAGIQKRHVIYALIGVKEGDISCVYKLVKVQCSVKIAKCMNNK